MVQNYPGPYELRLSYQTTASGKTLSHTSRLNVDLTAPPNPGDAFNNINAKTRGGIATPDLAAAVDAWLTLLQPHHHTSTTFGIVELWKYQAQSFQAQFISSYNPTVTAGTSIVVPGTAQQDVYTWRTIEGGILMVHVMQAQDAPYTKQAYPTGAGTINAVFDFVTSTVNWILARDTSYPFSSLNFLRGQNEKLFRTHFR